LKKTILTKICKLLYIFSVEYLSHLTLNHKIFKSCGAFCRIDDANVSNLILTIRPTELCDNLEHLRLTQYCTDMS